MPSQVLIKAAQALANEQPLLDRPAYRKLANALKYVDFPSAVNFCFPGKTAQAKSQIGARLMAKLAFMTKTAKYTQNYVPNQGQNHSQPGSNPQPVRRDFQLKTATINKNSGIGSAVGDFMGNHPNVTAGLAGAGMGAGMGMLFGDRKHKFRDALMGAGLALIHDHHPQIERFGQMAANTATNTASTISDKAHSFLSSLGVQPR